MNIENDLIKAKAHIDMALIGAQETTPDFAKGYSAGKSEAQRTQQLLADQLAAMKKDLEEELRLSGDRHAMFVALRTKNEELRAQLRAREAAREEAMRNSVSRAAFDELRARNDLLRTEYAANNTKIYQLRRERDAADGWLVASRAVCDKLRVVIQALRSELAELRANPEARTLRQQVVIDELRSELGELRAKLDTAERRSKYSENDDGSSKFPEADGQHYEARIMRQRETIMELHAKLDAIKAAAS